MRRVVSRVSFVDIALLIAVSIGVLLGQSVRLRAWGERGHHTVNQAAVRGIPDDGPVFLRTHEDWISYLGPIPDSWRGASEPFQKMIEDPNHGWFREQFAFMTNASVPRSRYEFVLALDREHRRLVAAGDHQAATLTNVRWTGTLPYAAVETYEQMVAGMRRYRAARDQKADTTFVEREIAAYMGRLGHYTADGAQPLHDSIHHDGWQGANPKRYTTDPRVHGRFESRFVDLIKLSPEDIQKELPPARVLEDPFDAVLAHLDDAGSYVEKVYQLDAAGAFDDAANADARALVRRQIIRAAALLRDLAHTAWIRSGERPQLTPGDNPVSPTHPHYNPATGSAPAPRRAAKPGSTAVLALPPAAPAASPVAVAHRYEPINWTDEVSGKNFPFFAMLDADASAQQSLAAAPALKTMLEARRRAVSEAAANCGAKLECHVAALRWSSTDIANAREALVSASRRGALTAIVARMRTSGLFALDASLDDEGLVAKSWERAAAGVNNILAVYALGEAPRYPAIDEISHDPATAAYGQVVHTTMGILDEQAKGWTRFYEPSREFALRLLRLNYRDEAARHEPMQAGENAAAFKRIPTIAWADYPFTVALVPGAGLSDQMEREHHAISPMGMQIIEIAARRYHERKVPLIIVSGGYVHPKHSQYAEAIEMKRVLMREFWVPEDAILIDPHARHTTTNVRNAARLMFRYGVPAERPALITTQQYHLDSIAAPAFDQRNETELGYRPYVSKRRLSRFELEWTPNVLSLFADSTDPLDP